MNALQERLEASIEAFGQAVTLEGQPARAMVRALSANQVKIWLASVPVDSADRPLRGFVFPGGTPIAPDQSIEWEGVVWRVRFVRTYDLGDTTLAVLAIAWPDAAGP